MASVGRPRHLRLTRVGRPRHLCLFRARNSRGSPATPWGALVGRFSIVFNHFPKNTPRFQGSPGSSGELSADCVSLCFQEFIRPGAPGARFTPRATHGAQGALGKDICRLVRSGRGILVKLCHRMFQVFCNCGLLMWHTKLANDHCTYDCLQGCRDQWRSGRSCHSRWRCYHIALCQPGGFEGGVMFVVVIVGRACVVLNFLLVRHLRDCREFMRGARSLVRLCRHV